VNTSKARSRQRRHRTLAAEPHHTQNTRSSTHETRDSHYLVSPYVLPCNGYVGTRTRADTCTTSYPVPCVRTSPCIQPPTNPLPTILLPPLKKHYPFAIQRLSAFLISTEKLIATHLSSMKSTSAICSHPAKFPWYRAAQSHTRTQH
jgi:hypothetical protein